MTTEPKPSATAGAAADETGPDRRAKAGTVPKPIDLPVGSLVAKESEPAVIVEATPPTAFSWLGSAVIDGLVHCACSHQSVHPDLLPSAIGDMPGAVAASRERIDDDPD